MRTRGTSLWQQELLVAASSQCRAWAAMGRIPRGRVLQDWMDWAKRFRRVEIKLLLRNQHIAICGLTSAEPGQGNVRRVMQELCAWADCAEVAALELTPTAEFGADLQRLKLFYTSLGFAPNYEVPMAFAVKEDMIFYPRRGCGHERCRRSG